MAEMSLGGLRMAFMPLFLGINLVNMLKSLVLLGLTCHLKMCLYKNVTSDSKTRLRSQG